MYKLKDLRNGLFQIHSTRHHNAYEGTPVSVFRMAVKMGLPEGELVHAVNTIQRLGHDYAEFNRVGQFVNSGRSTGGDGPHGFGWQ